MKPTRSHNAAALVALMSSAACDVQSPTPVAQKLPDAESPAAMLIQDRCGKCHGVPQPGIHNAAEWSATLHRMQKRMQQKGHRPLNEQEFRMLEDYLARHGRGAAP